MSHTNHAFLLWFITDFDQPEEVAWSKWTFDCFVAPAVQIVANFPLWDRNF